MTAAPADLDPEALCRAAHFCAIRGVSGRAFAAARDPAFNTPRGRASFRFAARVHADQQFAPARLNAQHRAWVGAVGVAEAARRLEAARQQLEDDRLAVLRALDQHMPEVHT